MPAQSAIFLNCVISRSELTYIFIPDTRAASDPEERGVAGTDHHRTSVWRRPPHQPAHSVGECGGTPAGPGER